MAAPTKADVDRMRRIIARVRSYGVEVREMPGWQTRGFAYSAVPTKIFDHHDASSRKSGEWGSLSLILDGTPRGIPGPLSNFQVARCLDNVPKLAVVCAGYAYHAGVGGPVKELAKDNANPHTFGTEKANDGLGEPYTAAANYATNALFHAAAIESGAIPESFPLGHKEWTTRKSDPTYSMPDRRNQVKNFKPTGPIAPQEEEDMNSITVYPPDQDGPTEDVLLVPANHKTLLLGTGFTWQNVRLAIGVGTKPNGDQPAAWHWWSGNVNYDLPVKPGVSRAALPAGANIVTAVHYGTSKDGNHPVQIATEP